MYLVVLPGKPGQFQQLSTHQSIKSRIASSKQKTLRLIMKQEHMPEEMALLQVHQRNIQMTSAMPLLLLTFLLH